MSFASFYYLFLNQQGTSETMKIDLTYEELNEIVTLLDHVLDEINNDAGWRCEWEHHHRFAYKLLAYEKCKTALENFKNDT